MEESVAILRALAAGFDPRTGEEFGEKGAWADPRVTAALTRAADALEAKERRDAARIEKPLPSAAGQPWTAEEDERLRTEYRAAATIRALAELHARTRGAISARLVRLGLVEPPVRTVSPGA